MNLSPNRILINPTIEEEFIEKFYRYFTFSITNECWEWNRKIRRNGYGVFTYKNRQILAHRFSYTLFYGEVPESLLVCHSCDNRKCVNPDHLFLGESVDNVHDMIRKGRHSPPPTFYGEKHSRAFSKLSKEDVINIFNLKDTLQFGDIKKIAKEYGVSTATISSIMSGSRWKWITQS